MSCDDPTALAELLCARLCHDLAGAVGAVGTGVELLTDDGLDGNMAADALALLAGSAAAAVHKLKFLRVALGGVGHAMSSEQIRAMIEDFLNSGMGGADVAALDWRDGEQRTWESGEVKLLLNLILLARDCLPRGGRLSVERFPATATGGLRITAQGVGGMPAESVSALQATDVSALRPRGAQGYYTALLARKMGLSINYEDSHDRVVFVTIKN